MDNDVYGHVNNVVYYSYFDTVVNDYLIRHGGLDIHAGSSIGVAVETHCQFMAPLTFPEIIDVGLRVVKLGTSSVRYQIGLFRRGDEIVAAEGYFVHVFVDRRTRRPQPIPEQIRAALERIALSDGKNS
jgi:acyl-CoA thioester hydrolase